MPTRRAFGVFANSLFRFSATTLLGCAFMLPCDSFFLRWFSFWSCWTCLRWLQRLVFEFSDYPIFRLPDLPILAAPPRPCGQLPCDCSAIRRSLHRRQFHSGCVWSERSNRACRY